MHTICARRILFFSHMQHFSRPSTNEELLARASAPEAGGPFFQRNLEREANIGCTVAVLLAAVAASLLALILLEQVPDKKNPPPPEKREKLDDGKKGTRR